jgi:hypothetical protein
VSFGDQWVKYRCPLLYHKAAFSPGNFFHPENVYFNVTKNKGEIKEAAFYEKGCTRCIASTFRFRKEKRGGTP